MNRDFVIDQLRSGGKTTRDIASAYVLDHPDCSEADASHLAGEILKKLKRRGLVEVADKVRMTYEAHDIVRGRIHTTHTLYVWRLVE